MPKINIAFGVTQDWLDYTLTTICSILSNSYKNNEYKFYIMSDIDDEKFYEYFEPIKQKLANIYPNFDMKYIKMDNSEFSGVVHDKRVGISAYYRLKLPSLVHEDKIIYLDSDIVVLDDISQLWNYNTDDFLLAAVEDKYSDIIKDKAGLTDNETYINSGVLLMNLKKFREQNIEDKIFSKLKEKGNDYSDQDALNDICKNQILYLPLKYNLMLTTDDAMAFPKRKKEYKKSIENPFILHYSIKPWILPVQYSEHWIKYSKLLK